MHTFFEIHAFDRKEVPFPSCNNCHKITQIGCGISDHQKSMVGFQNQSFAKILKKMESLVEIGLVEVNIEKHFG